VTVVVPNPAAVTRPVTETVATLAVLVCQVTPDVTGVPALVVTVSWLVCPTLVRTSVPERSRGRGVDCAGAVGEPQCAAPRLAALIQTDSKARRLRERADRSKRKP